MIYKKNMTTLTQAQQQFIIKQRGKIEGIQAVYKPSRNETEYLRSKIKALSGIPTGKVSDMYKQLLSLASLPTSNFIDTNRKTWFLNNS